MNWYKICPGEGNELLREFLKLPVVAVRYHAFDDVRGLSIGDMRAKAPQEAPNKAEELWTFVNQVHRDDRMIMYDQKRKRYVGGRIADCTYQYLDPVLSNGAAHTYQVIWDCGEAARAPILQELGRSLDQRRAFFLINEYAEVFKRHGMR